MKPPVRKPADERLDSWKAIAKYLGKTVRTVQRWETLADLPVRRIDADSGASVYAYKHELDRWLTSRNLTVHSPEPEKTSSAAVALPKTLDGSKRKTQRSHTIIWAAGLAVIAIAAWPLVRVLIESSVTGSDAQPVITTPRMLTTDAGIEYHPDISPDGRLTVYAWISSEGRSDIFVRVFGLNAARQLTDTEAQEDSPTWSPDGLSIAYLRHPEAGKRQIRIMTALGTEDRILHEFDVLPRTERARSMSPSLDWSPDGEWLVFSESHLNQQAMRLTLLRLSDRRIVPLTRFVAGVTDHAPAFSPGGKRLAFTRSPGALMGELKVLNLDLDDPLSSQEITIPQATEWNSDAAWSTDGQSLVFASGLWPRSRLYKVVADGSGKPQILGGIDEGASQVAISQLPSGKGSQMVYRMAQLENDIWRIDLEGEARDEAVIASSQRERFPDISSDGQITFLSDRNGNREIYTLQAGEPTWTQWTDWKSNYVRFPQFSPDGTTLAYIVEVDGQFSAHLQRQPMAPARSLQREGFRDIALAWSHDSNIIYTLSQREYGPDLGVWQQNLVTSESEQLIKGNYFPVGEDHSGRWLFLTSPQGDGNQLWHYDLFSGEFSPIDLGVAKLGSFEIGPDGVYFLASAENQHRIDMWDWDTRQARTIKHLDHKPEAGLAISPDGTFALLARLVQQRSDLMVVESN